MTQQTHTTGYEQNSGLPLPITRRTVLKGAAVTVGALTIGGGLSALSRPVAASSHATETLYLSSSEPVSGGQATRLFTVDLDGTFSPPRAVLSEIFVTTDPEFQRVDAIAASADGSNIYLIDRDSSHLGTYDVDTGTFADLGQITGLPNLTVLAAFSPAGDLYVASNNTDSLYTVDFSGSPPVANLVTALNGVDVNGADIAFDSNGTLFLHSNADDTLYTVEYDPASPTFGDATAVGASSGVSITGLAVRGDGNGDLVGSSRTRDAIVVFDKGSGAASPNQFDMYVDGSDTQYDYLNGDMTLGAIDPACADCEDEGLLAKYEFACVEEVEGECVAYDFVLEDGDGSLVTYAAGDFVSKDGEEFEPVSATFGTEYCTLWAVVKAGRAIEVQELTASEGEVTAAYVDPHAISFVSFYCTEAEAEAAANSFPSKGRGR